MSNIVRELIIDVAFRLGNPEMTDPFTQPIIFRQMKRLYESLNQEYYPIEVKKEFGSSDYTLDAHLGYSATEPSDVIELFKIKHYTGSDDDGIDKDFVDFDRYKNSDSRTFTMNNGRIYFSSIAGTETIRIDYYSMGKTLVDKANADVLATEVNDPEYDRDVKQILLYGTATMLKTDYPLYRSDLVEFDRLRDILSKRRFHKTSINPAIVGGSRQVISRLDYSSRSLRGFRW